MKNRQRNVNHAYARAASDAHLPRSAHAGVVDVLGVRMNCYVLADGRCLLSQRGINELFSCTNGGRNADGLPRFASTPVLAPFLVQTVSMEALRPLKFVDSRSGRVITAIDANVIADVCRAWTAAQDAGATCSMRHLAVAFDAELLLHELTQLGMSCLIRDAVHRRSSHS